MLFGCRGAGMSIKIESGNAPSFADTTSNFSMRGRVAYLTFKVI